VARLSLTLDDDTFAHLKKCAWQESRTVARVARELVREGLDRREAARRRRKLAEDYRAGRWETAVALSGLEAAQLEVLDP